MGPDDIGDDDPVLLREAPKLFFRHGGMTLSALRTEARKGRLSVIRIAGKDFVTRRAIKDMIELCRVEPESPARSASSVTAPNDSGISAQEALMIRLDALKRQTGSARRKGR